MNINIEKIGSVLGSKVYADVIVATENWANEFKQLTKSQIPDKVLGFMVLEGIIFLIYYYKTKFEKEFSKEEFDKFSKNILDSAAFSFAKFYMEDAPTKDVEQMYKEMEEEYSTYEGIKTNMLNYILKKGLTNLNWQFKDEILNNYIEVIIKEAYESSLNDIKDTMKKLGIS